MLSVLPTSRDIDDLTHEWSGESCAALFFAGPADDDCALCQIGCCVQRYTLGVDYTEPVVVHGVLGEA